MVVEVLSGTDWINKRPSAITTPYLVFFLADERTNIASIDNLLFTFSLHILPPLALRCAGINRLLQYLVTGKDLSLVHSLASSLNTLQRYPVLPIKKGGEPTASQSSSCPKISRTNHALFEKSYCHKTRLSREHPGIGHEPSFWHLRT